MAKSNANRNDSVELWEDLSSELWQVRDGSGPTRTMTLDALDAAFKRDEITTRTLVRKVGTFKWETLAVVAGIEPSAPMLESESLVPVTSEIDVSAPKIPRPAAMPRRVEADASAPWETIHSEDLLPDVNDTLNGRQLAGIGGTFDDDDDQATTRFLRQATTVRTPRTKRRIGARIFGVAAVAAFGVAAFGGVTFWLAREFGPTDSSSATSAMVIEEPSPILQAPPSPVVEPPPAPVAEAPQQTTMATADEVAPARAPLKITVEGSVLVLKNAAQAAATDEDSTDAPPPVAPAPAPVAARAVVGRRPPTVRVPAKKAVAPVRSHAVLRSAPAKKSGTVKAPAVQGSFKTKAR